MGSSKRMRTLIKVKTHQEKKAQIELMEIRRQKQDEEKALRTLEETRESAMQDAASKQRVSAADAQANSAYLQSISRQITQQEKKVDDIGHKEGHKREELVAKTQSKKMVEKLDQKRRAEVSKALDLKEQKMMDVFAQRKRKGA